MTEAAEAAETEGEAGTTEAAPETEADGAAMETATAIAAQGRKALP